GDHDLHGRGPGAPGAPGAQARLVSTGLSCDAHHETAPDVAGITRAMRDAFDRPGRDPADVSLVVAHGTGTALNDPAECQALREGLVQVNAFGFGGVNAVSLLEAA